MTKEQWDAVKKSCESIYSTAKLMIDGYAVTLQLQMKSPYKNVIAVYVNSEIRGEWIVNDCEIRRKFYQRHEKSLLPKKARDYIKKQPKKYRAELEKEYDRKYAWHDPYWSSFSALKKHLIANNTSIELLPGGE